MSEPDHPATPTPASVPVVSRPRLRRRDVAHLDPAHVRIGSTGVFAGTWALTDDNRYPVGYVGVLDRRWNGWAVFTCTRPVADAIVTDQQRSRAWLHDRLTTAHRTGDEVTAMVEAQIAGLWWDGDTVVHDERAVTGDPDAIHYYPPDPDGNYIICGATWTWEAVPPRSCDRIAGVLPARGDQQQWLPLRHSDLRVPHNRFTVTGPTTDHTGSGSSGVTAATVALDGTDLAVLTINADGAHLWLGPPNAAAGRQLDAFVAACRYRGRTVTAHDVLDALVTEAHTATYLAAAAATGATVVRLRDTDGHVLHLQPVPAGSDIADLQATYATRTGPPGGEWQIWSGHTWSPLHQIPATTEGRTRP